MVKSVGMDTDNKTIFDKIHLSCNALKVIACIFMVIDHIGYGILHNYMIAHAMDIMPEQYKQLNQIYETMRGVGRLAFPIFTFFIVEGFLRTRSVKKYAVRLLIFGIISEIPFDLGLFGKVFNWEHQNIMITFFLAILMLSLLKWLSQNVLGLSKPIEYMTLGCTVIAFSDIAYLIKADYSWKCMLLSAVLYFTREMPSFRLLAGAAASCWEKFAPISFVLLHFYDPTVKPKHKYAFYLFYPLNFIVIYLIARMII